MNRRDPNTDAVVVTDGCKEATIRRKRNVVRLAKGGIERTGKWLELWLVEDAGDGVLGVTVGDGQAEPLVVRAGADLLVAAGADAGHDPDPHLLVAVGSDRRGQPGDLGRAVDDDAADAQAQGGVQVAGRLGVAVQRDPLRREACGDREFQFAGRADVAPATGTSLQDAQVFVVAEEFQTAPEHQLARRLAGDGGPSRSSQAEPGGRRWRGAAAAVTPVRRLGTRPSHGP